MLQMGKMYLLRSPELRPGLTPARKWLWLKIKELGVRRFESLVSFTKMPFWHINLSHTQMNAFRHASGITSRGPFWAISQGCNPRV